MKPSASVLAAFGADSAPESLDGGQGTSWRCGDLVLKPSLNNAHDEWYATAFEQLRPKRYRLPEPMRTRDGELFAEGWIATRFIEGRHEWGPRGPEILELAIALHEDLAVLGRPNFLSDRTDYWAVAERAAWADHPHVVRIAELSDLIARCEDLRRDEGLTDQLVHSDVFGNVLFADEGLPVVLDLSPSWRPAGYAMAITAFDGMAWWSQPASLIDYVPERHRRSLLARAAMFRLVTAEGFSETRGEGYIEELIRDFSPVVELIESLGDG